jgi:hypothetical protein
VSGAFAGGLLTGAAYVAIQNTFTKIGVDHGSLGGMFAWLATFTTILPAIVGVGLGKNPSGFVSDIIRGFRPLAKAKPMAALGIGIEVLLYVLADTGTISNWWFTGVTLLMVLFWPAIAKAVMPSAFRTEGTAQEKSALDVNLEAVGIDTPMTTEILTELDDALGIPAATAHPLTLAAAGENPPAVPAAAGS